MSIRGFLMDMITMGKENPDRDGTTGTNIELNRRNQIYHGEKAEVSNFVADLGFWVYTEDTNEFFCGDGVTPGGHPYQGGYIARLPTAPKSAIINATSTGTKAVYCVDEDWVYVSPEAAFEYYPANRFVGWAQGDRE